MKPKPLRKVRVWAVFKNEIPGLECGIFYPTNMNAQYENPTSKVVEIEIHFPPNKRRGRK